MALDRQAAGRLAEEHLRRWRESTTYRELATRDLDDSVVETEVPGYTVTSTVWREEHSSEYVLSVKVTEAGGRRFFRRGETRYGRMRPDGSYVDGM